MKRIFRKILSFSLALIVLFSTMSFSVDMHFCGKTLVDFSIFKDADVCAMGMMEDSPCTTSAMEDGCCSNKQFVINGQDELKISLDKLIFEQQLFVALFYCSYSNSFSNQEEKESLFNGYVPPPLVKDIQILDETFII